MDQARLIADACNGDLDAFERLVIELQGEVRLFLAARCGDAGQVEELVQNTFVTAWGSLASYRHEGSFAGWLKGIARNLLLQDLRDRRRHGGVLLDDLDLAVHAACQQRLEAEDAGGGIDAGRLHQCLEQLSERARLMLVRHHVEGLPLNRLAQQFRQTRAAVAKILFSSRQALRACLTAGIQP